jgi:hypothetical protein
MCFQRKIFSIIAEIRVLGFENFGVISACDPRLGVCKPRGSSSTHGPSYQASSLRTDE